MSSLIDRWVALVRRLTQRWNIRGLPRLLFLGAHLLPAERRFFRIGSRYLALDPRNYTDCMMLFGRYAWELELLLRQEVKPGQTVVDIGAHVGYFTSLLAELTTATGRVYAFEPDSRPRDWLERVTRANGADWVEVLPVALSAECSTTSLSQSPVWGWSTLVQGSHLTGLREVPVETASLDELIEDGSVEGRVSFVKIDTEGHELSVLAGMRRCVERDRPILLIEVNPTMLAPQGLTPRDLLLWLERHEYTCYLVHTPMRGWLRREARLSPVTSDTPLGFGDILCRPKPAAAA